MWEIIDLWLGVRHSTHPTYEQAILANRKAGLDRVCYKGYTPQGQPITIQRYQVREA